MAAIHITDIESAINWWRERSPSPDGITACAEVRALAEVYALMVYYHEPECDEASMPPKARDAWLAWYATHARRAVHRDLLHRQGDAVCKGCGRTRGRGAALAVDDAGREARHLAPHHDGRHGLALQPLRRARPRARPAPTTRAPEHARAAAAGMTAARPRADSARRIAPLAWPVFVGQIAVLAFSTVDTVLVARYSALDLAALAVGAAAYITVFIGLMGVVLAVGPIVGQLFGAGTPRARPATQLHQAVWLALGLSLLGCTLLLVPEPFLALSQAEPGGGRQGARLPARRSPSRCPPRCCSPPIAASTPPCRGRRR